MFPFCSKTLRFTFIYPQHAETGLESTIALLTDCIMYRSNRSFNMEFDHQSLPGGGEFDPHALGVGNLNSTLDFM